ILLTFICSRAGLNVPTVGFAYLILVALLCVMGSFVVSVVLSFVAIACLNYFFAPPLYTLRVDAPEDIFAIVAFLTTSIIITSLAARARRTAEQTLASKKALVDTIPAMVWSADPDGSRDFHSQRWLDFTGLSAREATGKGWAATLYVEDRPAVMEKWQLAVTTGKPFEVEARARGANGQYRWFLLRAEPLRDERGTIVEWYGTSTDIEDRKRAIEALRESEEQWRQVFEHNPVMYFMIDPAGTVLSVNTFGAAQLGYAVNELIGQSVLSVFFEEDREAARRNIGACLSEIGRSHSWEIRKVRKDGAALWVRENAKAVRRTDNRLIVLVACEDITEGKQIEEKLRANEKELQTIIDTIPAYVGSATPDGVVDFISEAWLKYLGVTKEDWVGPGWKAILHPDDFERNVKGWLAAAAAGRPFVSDARYRRAGRGIVWFNNPPLPRRDGAGK